MMQSSKREDIIIELGYEYIRVGLVGDKTPRKTLKSSQLFKNPSTFTSSEFQMQLEEVLYNIFFSYINCSSQGRTVILLQKVFTDRRIIEAACKILFKKLKIERVQLALSCVTPLYLTGRYSGLVVSAGASAVQLMAIYDGYPLFTSYKCISTGTQALNRIIRDEIALLNKDLSLDILKQITDDQINEQIKNQYCSVTASSNPVTIAIKSKLRVKWVPDKVNFNIFFGNSENEEHNIANTFLAVLAQIPDKCLEAVSKNVVFAGGFWRIKGMQKLFKNQVMQQLEKFPKLVRLELKKKLGFASWSFNPSQVSWIGCSIGVSIRNIENLSLKRGEYMEQGFTEKVMSTYFLSS